MTADECEMKVVGRAFPDDPVNGVDERFDLLLRERDRLILTLDAAEHLVEGSRQDAQLHGGFLNGAHRVVVVVRDRLRRPGQAQNGIGNEALEPVGEQSGDASAHHHDHQQHPSRQPFQLGIDRPVVAHDIQGGHLLTFQPHGCDHERIVFTKDEPGFGFNHRVTRVVAVLREDRAVGQDENGTDDMFLRPERVEDLGGRLGVVERDRGRGVGGHDLCHGVAVTGEAAAELPDLQRQQSDPGQQQRRNAGHKH